MAEVALMSAVLCVISPVAIPLPISPVPLSLATFAVYLAGAILGVKRGLACVLVYLLLGAAGLPVFSGFSGGIGVLLGPTGGYLAGYLLCVAIVGGMTAHAKIAWNIIAMTIGTCACYVLGTAWFLIIMKGTYTVAQALLICVVPYLIFDMIKILAAAMLVVPINKILRRNLLI